MVIIFAAQGFYLVLFGLAYIFFAIGLIKDRFLKKFYFFGILPSVILLSLLVIMLGSAKDIPVYAQMPFSVGILFLIPFWILLLVDFYIYKKFTLK